MKKPYALLLAALLLLTSCSGPAEQPSQTAPPEAQPQEPVQAQPIQIGETLYLPLAQALEGTEITYTLADGRLTLTEKGLTAELLPGEPYLYRRGYITAVLPGEFVTREGEGYLTAAFREDFLADGTLMNDLLFFRDEAAEALDRRETGGESQAILDQLELPRSMDISVPYLDLSRIFDDRPLSQYPEILADELAAMGFEEPQSFTYSEYCVLTEARSVEAAGLSQFFLRNEALSGEDPAQWTVKAYHEWEADQERQRRERELTPESRAFLEERGIQLEDVPYLERVFYYDYESRTDEELRAVLQDYYQITVDFVRGE